MRVCCFQTLVEITDCIIRRTVYHTGKRQRYIVRSIRKLLISANTFLSKKIGIRATEAGRAVLIVYIHHQMIFGSQTNQFVQPRSPAVAGILYKTGLHAYNTPFPKYRKEFTRLLHQGMLVDVHPDANSFLLTVCYYAGHIQFVNHFCSIPVM